MTLEFIIDQIPVVYLSSNISEDTSADSAVVEGQEDIKEEPIDGNVESNQTDMENETSVGAEEGEGDLEASGDSEGSEEGMPDAESQQGESGDASLSEGAMEGGSMYGSMAPVPGTGSQSSAKDPLLSSPVAVIGISVLFLVVGGVLGFLLAKRKIKKGIDIYENC